MFITWGIIYTWVRYPRERVRAVLPEIAAMTEKVNTLAGRLEGVLNRRNSTQMRLHYELVESHQWRDYYMERVVWHMRHDVQFTQIMAPYEKVEHLSDNQFERVVEAYRETLEHPQETITMD